MGWAEWIAAAIMLSGTGEVAPQAFGRPAKRDA